MTKYIIGTISDLDVPLNPYAKGELSLGAWFAGITEEELQRDHAGIPHGGFVLRTGKTGLNGEHNHVIEYSLKLDSNPEFTSCVLTAYARAAYRMNQEGQKGCKTVFDVAPAYLSTLTPEEMRSALL